MVHRPILAAVAGAALVVGLAGGTLIGRYAWSSSDNASAPVPTNAAPQSSSGAAPGRLDANLGGLGAVLSAPRIHNLYWDTGWNTRAAHAGFSRGAINGFTTTIAGSSYLSAAGQYGVGGDAFSSSHVASPLCGLTRAPASVSAATVQAWITCMVTTIATGVPVPGFRVPVSNDLYIAYLPARTTISDNLTIPRFAVLGQSFGPLTILIKRSCTDYGAYHAFSAAVTGLFPYAVVPTRCFTGDTAPLDGISVATSHELVEAATDPLILAGWIDDSVTLDNFARLIRGEAADICSGVGAVPTTPVRRAGVLVAPYWSNSAGACVTSAAG